MLKNTLILYLALSLISCATNTKETAIQTFEEKVNLKNELTGIKIISKGNIGLMVVDSLLIVQKSNEPFLELYSTNSHRPVTTFGKFGAGPDEIMRPVLVKGIEYENGAPMVTAFDLTKRIINKVNLKNLLNNQEPILTQTTVPFTNESIVYFHYIDKEIILSTTEGNGRFTNYHFKKDSIDQIPFTPKLPFITKDDKKPIIYRSSVTVNKEKKLFAAFPLLINSVDIFDFNGNLTETVKFGNPNDLEQYLGTETNIEPYFFVRDSDSDSKYIYGLNINNRQSDLKSDLSNKLSVLVFDWEGNPVTEYILESDQASESMAFDPIHKRFYTYCRDCEESNILLFNIPK